MEGNKVRTLVRRTLVVSALTLAAFAIAKARSRSNHAPPRPVIAPPTTTEVQDVVADDAAVAPQPVVPELPEALPQPLLDDESRVLAAELSRMHTRDAEKLVDVVGSAARETATEIPITLMLAIAHAETNGRVLLISEAGAVGLAQTTPIAYLMEGGKGRLFVTNDYLVGARAYFLKKSLNDAEVVASLLIESPQARETAMGLLNAAYKYRQEGIPELEALAPYASEEFLDSIRRMDDENLATLDRLSLLIEQGAEKKELEAFKESVRDRYRALRTIQTSAWKSYQKDLTDHRDRLLRKRYGVDPDLIIRSRAYEASEMLAAELDERFSPESMASFLATHLATKRGEAEEIGTADWQLERMTAGLYNGGGHNIKRMMSGLIGSLRETDNYMQKVPATKLRLEQALAEYRANRPDETKIVNVEF
jgi:hypothetical protein